MGDEETMTEEKVLSKGASAPLTENPRKIGCNDDNMAAYEFELPKDFDYPKFKHDVKGGLNGYWAVALPEKGITRFRGVLLPNYVRAFVDYPHKSKTFYIVTPRNQKITSYKVAEWFFKKYPGGVLYKDGKHILP